jgi:type I restriction enzyme S subunit
MSEWRRYKLGDLIQTNQRSINSGYPFDEIEYLDTGSITMGEIDGFQKFKLSEAPSRAKRLVEKEDIIYSTVRPIQRHYGFIENPQKNLVVSTGFATITCKKDIINPKFLYYLLTSNEIVEYLDVIAEASTSAYPSLRPADIENLDITIPDLKEQKNIASMLSSLDDKIDLLRRQNNTLEKMAETLFRKWFEDNENDGNIFQLVYLQNGYAFKSKDFRESGANGVVKIKNISGGIIDIDKTDFIEQEVASNIQERFKIVTGDILIAMTGAEIGKLGIIPKTSKKLWLNQRVGLLKEKFHGSKYLAFLQLKSEFGQDYIEHAATGSAQPNISASSIENCGFPKLSTELIKEYSKHIGELYDKVIFNLGQINTLSAMRETLLSKLIRGEITIESN